MTDQDHTPRFLDVAGVAAYCGISERQVRAMVFRRAIPFTKVGRLLRFDTKSIDAWLESNAVPARDS